jgi:hypothetical protein
MSTPSLAGSRGVPPLPLADPAQNVQQGRAGLIEAANTHFHGTGQLAMPGLRLDMTCIGASLETTGCLGP